ncbi:MAG: hypothetical protein AB8G22_21255 [Saprospiraceae bacterium]
MKNWFLLFALFTFSQLATAQLHSYDSFVQEEEKMMSKGSNNGFTITLSGINKDMAEDVWKKFSKTYDVRAKRDRKTKEYFADNAQIGEMSNNPVDIYTTFSQADTNTVVNFWFDLGGAYLSSDLHNEQVSAANTVLQSYAFAVGKKRAEEELKVEEKVEKELEKQFEKLEKENKEFHKRIEEAKELIAKMEKNIEVNLEEQEKKKMEMNTQKEVIKVKENVLSEFN